MSRAPAVLPPWCGNPKCDPRTRMVEVGDDARPVRCPCTGPQSAAALRARLVQLQAEVRDVEEQLAAAEAPEWARGPGRGGA